MMKSSHKTLYALSGLVWFGVGIMLLNLGLGFLMQGFQRGTFNEEGYSSLFTWCGGLTGRFDYVAILFIAISLAVGFAKGRFVLQKTALRSADRIAKLTNPTPITNLYTRSNLAIIGGMMCLGMFMKVLNLPVDIRGAIDTAVGCALMQGSLAYFQLMGRTKSNEAA